MKVKELRMDNGCEMMRQQLYYYHGNGNNRSWLVVSSFDCVVASSKVLLCRGLLH